MTPKIRIFRGLALAFGLSAASFAMLHAGQAMNVQRSMNDAAGPMHETLVGTWAGTHAACADPAALRLHPDGRMQTGSLRGFWHRDGDRLVLFVRTETASVNQHERQRSSFRSTQRILEFGGNRLVLASRDGERVYVRCP